LAESRRTGGCRSGEETKEVEAAVGGGEHLDKEVMMKVIRRNARWEMTLTP
jgi:hypothetical protein